MRQRITKKEIREKLAASEAAGHRALGLEGDLDTAEMFRRICGAVSRLIDLKGSQMTGQDLGALIRFLDFAESRLPAPPPNPDAGLSASEIKRRNEQLADAAAPARKVEKLMAFSEVLVDQFNLDQSLTMVRRFAKRAMKLGRGKLGNMLGIPPSCTPQIEQIEPAAEPSVPPATASPEPEEQAAEATAPPPKKKIAAFDIDRLPGASSFRRVGGNGFNWGRGGYD